MHLRWNDFGSRLALTLCLGILGVSRMKAQSSAPTSSIGAELQQLARSAGTIFVGQITSISRQSGFVEITFSVEQPVRGAAGQSLRIREWSGLWPPGQNRYTVGQRVLAFLHAASGVGFSSPVHGGEGMVPVVVQGMDAPRLLDIRRIAASVLRAPGTPLPTDANGAIQLQDALSLIAGNSVAEPARKRLPLRGAPPSTALQRLVQSSEGSSTRGPQWAPVAAPILRRDSSAHR